MFLCSHFTIGKVKINFGCYEYNYVHMNICVFVVLLNVFGFFKNKLIHVATSLITDKKTGQLS